MKQSYMILALLLCISNQVYGGEDSLMLRRGDLIGNHLSALKKYGDGNPFLETLSSIPGTTEVMMWQVGDGVLVVETSFSAGIIKAISYVIITGKEKKRTTLMVKEFNPANGEMTMCVFNNAIDKKKE